MSGPKKAAPRERHPRQAQFAPLGQEGQARLGRSQALIVGVGATGSALAEGLVRAGIGALRLVDRDLVEASNLGRQALYSEADIGNPKALAAAQRLAAIDAAVTITAKVADAGPRLLERLSAGVDLILDGTDNFATRYLINEIAVRDGLPWIYSGAIGATAVSLPVLPGETACLACLYPEAPANEESCESAGILQAAVLAAAALSLAEALKILAGRRQDVRRELWHVDLWRGDLGRVRTHRARPGCPVCQERRFARLTAVEAGLRTTRLCARALQVAPPEDSVPPDLDAVASHWPQATKSPHGVLLVFEGRALTLFPDGRLIVEGDCSPEQAKTLYRKILAEA